MEARYLMRRGPFMQVVLEDETIEPGAAGRARELLTMRHHRDSRLFAIQIHTYAELPTLPPNRVGNEVATVFLNETAARELRDAVDAWLSQDVPAVNEAVEGLLDLRTRLDER